MYAHEKTQTFGFYRIYRDPNVSQTFGSLYKQQTQTFDFLVGAYMLHIHAAIEFVETIFMSAYHEPVYPLKFQTFESVVYLVIQTFG